MSSLSALDHFDLDEMEMDKLDFEPEDRPPSRIPTGLKKRRVDVGGIPTPQTHDGRNSDSTLSTIPRRNSYSGGSVTSASSTSTKQLRGKKMPSDREDNENRPSKVSLVPKNVSATSTSSSATAGSSSSRQKVVKRPAGKWNPIVSQIDEGKEIKTKPKTEVKSRVFNQAFTTAPTVRRTGGGGGVVGVSREHRSPSSSVRSDSPSEDVRINSKRGSKPSTKTSEKTPTPTTSATRPAASDRRRSKLTPASPLKTSNSSLSGKTPPSDSTLTNQTNGHIGVTRNVYRSSPLALNPPKPVKKSTIGAHNTTFNVTPPHLRLTQRKVNSPREPLKDRNRMGPVAESQIDANNVVNGSPEIRVPSEKEDPGVVKMGEPQLDESHAEGRALAPSTSSGIESTSSNNSLTSGSLCHEGATEELLAENTALKARNGHLESLVNQLLGQINQLVENSNRNNEALAIVIQVNDKEKTNVEESLIREKNAFQVREKAIEAEKLNQLQLLREEFARERECRQEEVESLKRGHEDALEAKERALHQEISNLRVAHAEELSRLQKKHKDDLNAHKMMSPKDRLVKEISSLEAVLELRNNDIRSLRHELDAEKCRTEELERLQERANVYKARLEEFDVKMQKSKEERKELEAKIRSLENDHNQVVQENSLLSQQKDELDYKIKSLSIDECNFGEHMSKSVYSTPSAPMEKVNGVHDLMSQSSMPSFRNGDPDPFRQGVHYRNKSPRILNSTPSRPNSVPAKVNGGCHQYNHHREEVPKPINWSLDLSQEEAGLLETSPISHEPSPLMSPMDSPESKNPAIM